MLDRIERNLKAAMLSGDKSTVETLKGLKNALLYEAVSLKIKPEQLNEEQILVVFGREAKKRQEATDLYKNAGETGRAEAELAEKAIIDEYLPEQMDEGKIQSVVDEEISKFSDPTLRDMGRIIGAVKSKLGARADGTTIAKIVKEKLEG